ncbi:MAG: cytochrome c oxidase subunit II [Planctomycetota bacterium]|jgi:hypothetical protein
MVVEVEARQWAWTFTYPDVGISASELYVPVNTPVKLELSSPVDDVIHSLYLPDFRVKEDCVPGLDTYLWFEADRISTHNIFCAEFCGKDHARMLSRLHVLSQEDYEAWLDEELAHRFRPIDIDVALNPSSEDILACDAPSLFLTYCASCHGREGEGGLVEGARNFNSLENWKRGPKISDIFRTLTVGLEGTQMRAFSNLSAWDRFALAHHVADFYTGIGRPETTDEDAALLVEEFKLDQQQEVQREFPIEETIEAMAEEAERRRRENDN